MIAKVSTSTQFDSAQSYSTEGSNTDYKKKATSKRQATRHMSVLADYLDLDNTLDIEKLRTWCQSQWFTTLRVALLHSNRLQYHSCCNSFSRRHFIRYADHPEDETFDVNKLRDFKTIETGDDFYRWQLNLAKENRKNGFRTLFPSINSRHYGPQDGLTKEGQDSKAMLRKRMVDLEHEIEEKRKLLHYVQIENARLLRSSKAWHSKYEELLEIQYPANDLLATPKKTANNWLVLEDS
jgi:hypothetical protein